MGRTCENCGLKMHPFSPRKRIDGKLICRNCIEGRPGRPRAQAVVQVEASHFYDNVIFEVEPDEWSWVIYDENGNVVKTGLPAVSPDPDTASRVMMYRHGNPGSSEYRSYDPGFTQKLRAEVSADPRKAWGMRVEAHDSGDGETIYHCPFCGGGQVTGRSDGTAECDYCHKSFTVQVQPELAAMPQTIDGAPVDMPGMPGAPGGDQAVPEAPGGAQQPPGGAQDAFVPPGVQALPPGTPAPGGAFVPPQPKAASLHTEAADSGNFSPTEQRIIDYLYGPERPWGFGHIFIDDLAKALGIGGSGIRELIDTLQDLWERGWISGYKVDSRGNGYWSRSFETFAEAYNYNVHGSTSYEGPGRHEAARDERGRRIECLNCDHHRHDGEQCSVRGCRCGTSKQSLYIGPEGVAMPEESFIRHLALRFADDREAVLDDIREANAR